MEGTTDICTLRILHLPPSLSDERRVELFKHYGAVQTRTIRKSEKYTITFVEFPTKDHAYEVLLRFHQLSVKGRRLSIEFANRNVSMENKENTTEADDALNKEDVSEKKANFQAFLKKLNTWAPYHLLTQPVPPYLRYKYPEPTRTTLLRIAIQMVKVPAFYTQVLHLMNKMNLPPPFEGLDDQIPMLKEEYDMEKYQDLFDIRIESENVREEVAEPQEMQLDDSDDEEESEIESDKETSNAPQHIIPEKRRKIQPKKRLKIPKFVNPLKQGVTPSTSQKQRPEDMFDLPTKDDRKRKIAVKTLDSSISPAESTVKSAEATTKAEERPQFIVQPSSNSEGFGLIFPAKKDEDTAIDKEDQLDFITTEQLHENRISTEDQRVLPVFKNYHPGMPSKRLYIKNLAKQVEEKDLHFIYRRYILPSSSGSESEYNIRLMQEGRMKGQAFVTLPNVAQAQLALSETNGYILKDKPMVVHFAKVTNT